MTTTEEAIRDAKNRWARRRRRLIGYGQWQPFVDAAPVRQHVLAIQASGMGVAGIAARTGVNRGSIDHLLYGSAPCPPAVQIRTENAAALLSYWPTLDDYEDRSVIDGTGTRRRMQALAATGLPPKAVHRQVRIGNPQTFEHLTSRSKVTARTARAVRDFYNQASTKTAEQYGVTPGIATRTRNWAAKNRWAGPEAWDDDLIDDPAHAPDWTGHCGTDRGYWTHRWQKIPVCGRCESAHAEWLAARADLGVRERTRQQLAARAAAAHREADLAHDARELMRVSGLDYEQAAERLGVTRQHLQQALVRHPEAVAA
ncbi:hypothetical protein [Streptomyces formicae]